VSLAGILALLAGCGSLSTIQVFPVSIVNDTTNAFVVRDCDDYCSSSPIAVDLEPGGSTVINRVTGSHKSFSITTASGMHVGCLDLFFEKPEPHAEAPVSEAAACTGHQRPVWETAGLAAILILLLALPFVLVRRR